MDFDDFVEIKPEVFEDGSAVKQEAPDLMEIKQEVFEEEAVVKLEGPEDFEIVLSKQEEQLVESQYWADLLEEVKQEGELR